MHQEANSLDSCKARNPNFSTHPGATCPKILLKNTKAFDVPSGGSSFVSYLMHRSVFSLYGHSITILLLVVLQNLVYIDPCSFVRILGKRQDLFNKIILYPIRIQLSSLVIGSLPDNPCVRECIYVAHHSFHTNSCDPSACCTSRATQIPMHPVQNSFFQIQCIPFKTNSSKSVDPFICHFDDTPMEGAF